MIYSQTEIEAMFCDREECTHEGESVLFKSVCHPEAAYWARYGHESKTILLYCAACGKGIAEFVVGVGPVPNLGKTILRLIPGGRAEKKGNDT